MVKVTHKGEAKPRWVVEIANVACHSFLSTGHLEILEISGAAETDRALKPLLL